MKLKDIEGLLPENNKHREDCFKNVTIVGKCMCGATDKATVVTEIGEKELSDFVEIDVERVKDTLNKQGLLSLQVREDIAQAIAKEFPIRVVKDLKEDL